uniref:Uncharacterized protein n=1 Tax=Solanum lycopersicum TaxID=4081 RepID=A0A3Q7JAP9_SOLLC
MCPSKMSNLEDPCNLEVYGNYLGKMKRLKSDVVDTPPFKRPICSSNEESLILGFNAYFPNGYEIMLNDEEKISLKNATNYEEERNFLENIKKCFGNDNEYKLFIDIMMMYKKERKDLNEVYNDVAVLFKDHHDLLDEFSKFLKDSVSPNPLSSLLLLLDPLLPCGYDIILNDEVKPLKKSIHYEQKERKDVKDVYHEVSVLLSGRPDLLDEFSGFLPDSVTTNIMSNLDDNKN